MAESSSSLPWLAKASLAEILKAPVSPDDLQMDLTKEDIGFVSLFEEEWAKFLVDNPHMVPQGKREARIQELQTKVNELETSRESVETELKNQLAFFRSSREKLEDNFAAQTKEANEKQRRSYAELSRHLDTVAIADHLQQQTLPWKHFLQELDSFQEPKEDTSATTAEATVAGAKKAKPSARAMALTDQSSGDPADIQLRAYRIDHALLSTHIAMVQKEIERVEKTVQSQERASKFLTEHNVWGILNKSSTATTASAESTTAASSTNQSSRES